MTSPAIDDGFEALLTKVERERGFACASYKQKCLRRRVAVRMRARGLESFAGYALLLDADPTEFDRLVDSLTINVTKFFRNPAVWARIATDVVPALWANESPDLRLWSAGCASGEEAYSMAMLFHRHAAVSGMLGQIDRVSILGTDVDRGALADAERGSYTASDVAETPAELSARYFATQNPYTPALGIRKMVRFAWQDLLSADYPPAPQHVIICRNVLIYLDRPSQERVIERLYQSLVPGGYLILGTVETLLGVRRGRFAPVAQRERIFRKAS